MRSGEKLVYFTPKSGDQDFPYAIVAAGLSTRARRDPVVSQVYRHHTLIFTISGRGRITQNATTFDAAPNSVAWLDTAQTYAHGCHAEAPHWHYAWLAMTGFGLDHLHAEHVSFGPPVFDAKGALAPLFQAIPDHLSASDPRKGAASTAFAAQILAALLTPADPDKPRRASPLERSVLAPVRADLAGKWSVARMADLAGTSAPHFHRLFKREIGLAPMEWLRIERINAAKYMLARGTDRLNDIARRCGYPDPYNFSRVFCQYVGEPPSRFRKSSRAIGV